MIDLTTYRKIVSRGGIAPKQGDVTCTHVDHRPEPKSLPHEHCGLSSCATHKQCCWPSCCISPRREG